MKKQELTLQIGELAKAVTGINAAHLDTKIVHELSTHFDALPESTRELMIYVAASLRRHHLETFKPPTLQEKIENNKRLAAAE